MILLFTIVMLMFPLFISQQVSRKVGIKYNPFSVMTYIWAIMLVAAVIFGEKCGLYAIDISGILVCSFFLSIIGLIVYVFAYRSYPNENGFYEIADTEKFQQVIGFLTKLSFLLWIIGTSLYFIDLNRLIPLSTLPNQIWKWKNYVLTGVINENSIKYLGRNLNLIGLIFSLNYKNKKTKKSLLLVILYVLIAFIDTRKDPIISTLVYVLIPFLGRENKKIIRIMLPLGTIFALFSIFTMQQLNFGSVNWLRTISIYSFGTFNSLQKALDVGMESGNNLFLGNTFYFVYSIIKYFIPSLAPSGIVLESLGPDTSNVYTAIIPVVMDSSNAFEFIFFLFIYAFFIGIVMTTSINLYNRKPEIETYLLYSCVFSCAVRTFYNPTFSYLDLIFAIIYIVIIRLITRTKSKRRI